MNMRSLSLRVLTVVSAITTVASTAGAQSIGAGLSRLLTEQTPAPSGYVRDMVAADAMFDTVLRKTGRQMAAAASWQHGPFETHANGGFGFGGVSREQFVSGSVTMAAGLRVTIIGELIGRRLSDLYSVADVYEPHPVLAGVDTMRWLPAESGVRTALLVTGVKWNLVGNWLLNTHLLTRLTDAGLRARFTPSLSFDYAMGL
ncbi:MAG: hypothetical protein ABI868_06825 [Acidobacteriota bacterium]